MAGEEGLGRIPTLELIEWNGLVDIVDAHTTLLDRRYSSGPRLIPANSITVLLVSLSGGAAHESNSYLY